MKLINFAIELSILDCDKTLDEKSLGIQISRTFFILGAHSEDLIAVDLLACALSEGYVSAS